MFVGRLVSRENLTNNFFSEKEDIKQNFQVVNFIDNIFLHLISIICRILISFFLSSRMKSHGPILNLHVYTLEILER